METSVADGGGPVSCWVALREADTIASRKRLHPDLRGLAAIQFLHFDEEFATGLSAVKRLEYLRSFLRYCKDEGEMKRIIAPADALEGWGSFGPKARAMVLLLRYTGLRMQDAACLERSRVTDGRLFLFTQKTGTPVYCPLPPEIGRPASR